MRLLLLIILLSSPAFSAEAGIDTSRELRVLFIGNSLTYVNNLPAMVRALAAAQPAPVQVETTTFVIPGGTLDEHWRSGHAARALRDMAWDAVVLQERGGVPACLLDTAPHRKRDCRASMDAHRRFAGLARAAGARALVMTTWSPERERQPRLDRATRKLASNISAEVVPAGSALHGYARQRGHRTAFPDGTHPGLPATMIIAAQLYRALSGREPMAVDVAVAFPLLPPEIPVRTDRPLEQQPALMRGTSTLLLKANAIEPLLDAAAR